MLSRKEAEILATEYINRRAYDIPGGVVLLEHHTLEKPYGWVFFYNSRRFLETGDIMEALGGNSPFVIEAKDGRITSLGTARPVEESLREFELRRGLR